MSTTIKVNEGGSSGKFPWILSFILLVLLVVSWITRPTTTVLPPVVHTNTVVRVDTVWYPQEPREPEIIRDTVLVVTPSRVDSTIRPLLPVHTYIRDFQDDILDGRMVTLVQGWLLSQRMFYTPRIPREIVITRDSTITTTERIVIERSFLQAGLEVGIVDARFQVNPMVGYTHRTGHTVFYRYTPWMNGHTIGFLTPIRIPWIDI